MSRDPKGRDSYSLWRRRRRPSKQEWPCNSSLELGGRVRHAVVCKFGIITLHTLSLAELYVVLYWFHEMNERKCRTVTVASSYMIRCLRWKPLMACSVEPSGSLTKQWPQRKTSLRWLSVAVSKGAYSHGGKVDNSEKTLIRHRRGPTGARIQAT